MTVGAKIKAARLNKGITQEELADRIGCKKSAIAKWETGRVENIKRSNLAQLAEALDISPAELIGSNYVEPEISPAKAEITGIIQDMTDDQLKEVLRYIKFIKQEG